MEESSLDTKLGRIEGRLEEMAKTQSKMAETMLVIAKNEARVDTLEITSAQHDKRIVALEKRCEARGVMLERLDEHVKNDKPVEHVVGVWALRMLLVSGGLIVGWLIDRLPRIIALLG